MAGTYDQSGVTYDQAGNTYDDFGGTTPVTASAVASWHAQGAVTVTATGTWTGHGAVSALANARWTVTGSLTTTADARWTVLSAAVVATASANWGVGGAVAAATAATRWNALAAVTATASGRWHALTLVTAAPAARWETRAGVTAPATARWTAGGPPAAFAEARWANHAGVTATTIARWNAIGPSQWNGVTARGTGTAGAGTFTRASGYWLTGATATARAVAGPGGFELGAAPPVWAGETASAAGGASPGAFLTGVQVVGDSFNVPDNLSGLSGTGVADLANAGVEVGEPYTHGATRTWWFRYTAAGPGILTITTTDVDNTHWVDVYEGDMLAELTLLGGAGPTSTKATTLPVVVSYGSYFIRVASSAAVAITITFTASVIVPELIVENRTPTVTDTPNAIRVGVLNAEPEEDVRFEWYPPVSQWVPATTPRPITLITLAADETGAILAASVPLSQVQAGTHIVYARGLTSGRDATVTVTVENNPSEPEVVVADDTASGFVVGRWSMHDAAPGGLGNFVFPLNPTSMTSPYAPRLITAEHTTAANGQAILWEGGLVAHDWSFGGYVDTQAFHDSLVAFAELNRRFRLRDHRQRTWVVAFSGIDIKPRRSIDKPWSFEYTVQAHIYGQVTT